MNNLILFLMIPLLYLVMLSTPFNCQAFRCGDEFVSGGDSTGKVIARCGEPDERIVSRRTASGEYLDDSLFDEQGSYKGFGYVTAYITEEKWYYDCGDNDFRYELKFENDVMISEDNAGRGRGSQKCLSAQEKMRIRPQQIKAQEEADKKIQESYYKRLIIDKPDIAGIKLQQATAPVQANIDLCQARKWHIKKASELYPIAKIDVARAFKIYRDINMNREQRKQFPIFITRDTDPCQYNKQEKQNHSQGNIGKKHEQVINSNESSSWFQCKDRDGNVTFSNVGCPD